MMIIYYPQILSASCIKYCLTECMIDSIEPTTYDEMQKISTPIWTGTWKAHVNHDAGFAGDIIYLGEKSFITIDNIRYNYCDFPKLAKILSNLDIEKTLETL